MPETLCSDLPLLVAEQAQKHVTHNEALTALDAIVQLAVKDRDLATPPGKPERRRPLYRRAPARPTNGRAMTARSPPGRTAPGLFTLRRKAGAAGSRTRTCCSSSTARAGSEHRLADHRAAEPDAARDRHDGGRDEPVLREAQQGAVDGKYAAEGGDGDLRYTLNKETAADVLSLLLQTAFPAAPRSG